MTVSMQALVIARKAAQGGGRSHGGNCALVHTRHGGGVVREVLQGGISHIVRASHDIDLGQQSCMFKVAVGDVALGVVRGDQSSLHCIRKGHSPHVGVTGGVEVHPSHA